MILRNITYVKYMSRKEAAKNKQLLFSFYPTTASAISSRLIPAK